MREHDGELLGCYIVIVRAVRVGQQAQSVGTKGREINVKILHLCDIEGGRKEGSILREIEKVEVTIVCMCINNIYVNIGVAR